MMVFICHSVIGTGDLQPREHKFVLIRRPRSEIEG